MCGTYQFRRTSELGASAGRRNLSHGFAAPHQCPGESLKASASLDGYRFSGEHGLVEQDRALDQTHVGSDHRTQRKLDDVPRDQLSGWNDLPGTVTPYRRVQREPRLQGGKRRLRTSLLNKSQGSVEQQQTRNDGGLDILAKTQLEEHRSF